jgi:hypothetical protein
MWLGFTAAGCAVAFGWRGDWAGMAVALAVVAVPVILGARREFAAAAAVLREVREPEPCVPRPREPDHPPWLTAPMPVIGHEAECPAMSSMMPDDAGRAARCRCGAVVPIDCPAY